MYGRDILLDIYGVMCQIRAFEEKALQYYKEDKLRGSIHLYIGQEAISASIIALLGTKDYITSTHRGHGHGIAKSRDLKRAFAELMGKETGFCMGRGGSMHICDLEKGNLGANAIVGGGIPIAVGGALAQQLRGSKNVTVSFFGDGASNQGTFHESLNLASVWKLPVIFVCENNGFGITVPARQSTSVENIADRAVGYAMPGYVADGNDVINMLDVFSGCLERARNGGGPSLIEAKTYRLEGHWIGDPEVYRTRDDVALWAKKCPIKRHRAYLLSTGAAGERELWEIENKAVNDVAEAAEFASNSREPDPAGVMDGVFYESGDAE